MMRLLRIALLGFALTAHSCFGHTSGDLQTSKLGNVSSRAARVRADDQHVDRCGVGELTDRGSQALRRQPYLQRVDSDSALVMFTTRRGEPPIVDVTTPDGEAVSSAVATVDTTAERRENVQWVTRLRGLEAGTLYCYAVRHLTTRTGFVTAPVTGQGLPVRFVAFGDSGTGSPDQFAVMRQMETVAFDLMIHTGDVAYPSGRLSDLETKHFSVYAPLLAKFPFFPSAGNHDMRTADGLPFRQVFALPENGGSAGRERYYSFNWGDVHFVALDTEAVDRQQAAWLDRDLARNRLPWTVVYLHKPPYSSGRHGPELSVQRRFVPLFDKYRVDLVLGGHEHHYERFKPTAGVHYIVTGGGGNSTRRVGAGPRTAFSESVLHFLYVEVLGSRLALHAIDGAGSEFDSLLIDKSARL